MGDILTVPEFCDIEIAFTDINPDNLRMMAQLCQRDIEENGLDIRIHVTLDRREAFKDAKYVINCVCVGMLEAFETDVEIPLKYGVDQCVDIICTGLNHQTWYISVKTDGVERTGDIPPNPTVIFRNT